MSDLKKALRSYEHSLAERGYRPVQAIERGPTYCSGGRKFISFDRVKGGDLRCFLGDTRLSASRGEFEIEGESPWWHARDDEDMPRAVASAIGFLLEAGFFFLDDPLGLVPTEWREQYGILVKDARRRIVHFSAQAGAEPNRVILACMRTHPTLRGQPALKVREILGRNTAIPTVYESLAFALETKKRCEAEGLVVRISE